MSEEGERSGAVVKNMDNADGDRLSVRLTTLQGVYPVPPVESLKVERQNALYVSAGMSPVPIPSWENDAFPIQHGWNGVNVMKFPTGKP